MKTWSGIIFSCAASAAFTYPANPAPVAPGDLDVSFGDTGKVTTAIGTVNDEARSVAIQSDGKILVAGNSNIASLNNFAVVRYDYDGSLDTSFNGTGKVTTKIGSGQHDAAESVAVQSDGMILVAGYTNNGTYGVFAVARYNANGNLDATFNGTGKVTTAIGGYASGGFSVAIQSDGRILVAGHSYNGADDDFALVRYNPNGSLDATFNGTGKVTTDISGNQDEGEDVAIQNDGKILVTGGAGNGTSRDFALVRYNADGSLDTTFNGTGKVITDIGGYYDGGESVAIQNDGKILVAGYSYNNPPNPSNNFALARYNADGTLDTTFHGTGSVTTHIGSFRDEGRSVAIQGDGRILVAGSSQYNAGSYNFAVVRYEGDFDEDGDGVANQYETGTGMYVSPTDTGTSSTNPDSDRDGLTDGQEVYRIHSNPNVPDTDGDGFDDGFEVSTGFSPTSAASTPDALSSALPAVEFRFNAANGISYRIEASFDLQQWTTIETPAIGNGGVVRRLYFIDGQPKRFFRSRRN
jgi:uncharacterized delta-60 repeat protein